MNNIIDSAINALSAKLANFTQDTRLLRIHTSLGENKLIVESFTGSERGISVYHLRTSAISASNNCMQTHQSLSFA